MGGLLPAATSPATTASRATGWPGSTGRGRLETTSPGFVHAALDAQGFPSLTFQCEPNRPTTVLRSTDLRVWSEIRLGAFTPRFVAWSDTEEHPARFYRIRQEW
ncbi:MAG: hypothetical protein M5U12_35595 [Verrucomicrobia bacterium]|nr:hypothetical protein [Verrucomicrobiota bacterium]